MADEEKKLAIALPGEWALQKTLGPVLSEIGEDLKKLYAKGRDNIISKAYKKIADPEDGKSANLRIAHDVLTNGAFTDEEICAEYFGGILASSRTDDGKNDDAIQFVDTIKSLSSKQLHLHYVFYNSLNRLLVQAGSPVNVGQSTEINGKEVWFSTVELVQLGLRIDTDFNILHRQGLLSSYQTNAHPIDEKRRLPYAKAGPTTFGVFLYAIAHNRLAEWRSFDSVQFEDFDGISLPSYYAFSVADLLKAAGITQPES
jgi:hypothetical protein